MTQSPKFGPLQIAISLLAIATAAIHLVLGFQAGMTLFILNGLGYIALLAALYLPMEALNPYRRLARWVLMGYTLLTVVLYFVMSWPDIWSPLGLATKGIEIVLVVLLWLEQKTEATAS